MSRFARRPSHLPIALPRLDGSGWPDQAAVGRPSFDTSTYYELAVRHAYDPEAHAAADRLVDELLPDIDTAVSAEDEPYLRKVFSTAARIGAGLGLVERTLASHGPDQVDRSIAGALWEARRTLPAMRPDWAVIAGWFLLAGFHLGRGGPGVLDRLREDLAP